MGQHDQEKPLAEVYNYYLFIFQLGNTFFIKSNLNSANANPTNFQDEHSVTKVLGDGGAQSSM